MSQSPENPFKAAPVYQHSSQDASQEGDATGGVIPYKNPHALIAYYMGIVSLLPAIGIPFALVSIVLGFMGLSRRKANPIIKGSVHAWIGIVLGFASLLCQSAVIVLIIIAIANEGR